MWTIIIIIMFIRIITVTSMIRLMDASNNTQAINASNYTDIQTLEMLQIAAELHNNLTNKAYYKSSMRPDFVVAVEIDFRFSSLIDFDEVNGELHVTGLVSLKWKDLRLSWSRDDFNIDDITLNVMEIWRPNIVLFNAARQFQILDRDMDRTTVQVNSSGNVHYGFGGIFSVTCDSDMTFYPNDVHECYLMFAVLEDVFPELIPDMYLLSLMHYNYSNTIYDEDVTWVYYNSQNCIRVMYDSSSYFRSRAQVAIFPLRLERRSVFTFVNFLFPIILQGFLNAYVFHIPVEAGERLSFAITLFLSYTVFFTAMTQYFPDSSSNSPLFSFFLISMLCESAFIVFLSIEYTRLYIMCDKLLASRHSKRLTRIIGRTLTFAQSIGRKKKRTVVNDGSIEEPEATRDDVNTTDDEQHEKDLNREKEKRRATALRRFRARDHMCGAIFVLIISVELFLVFICFFHYRYKKHEPPSICS